MPHIDEHCADCLNSLGSEFREVHEWLDEFAESIGPAHRDIRHHAKGIEHIRQSMGEQEAKAAEIHILKDCHDKIPTIKESQMQSIFNRKAGEKLIEEFGQWIT